MIYATIYDAQLLAQFCSQLRPTTAAGTSTTGSFFSNNVKSAANWLSAPAVFLLAVECHIRITFVPPTALRISTTTDTNI